MVELKKKVTLRSKTAEAPVEETPKPQVTLKKKQSEPTPTPAAPVPPPPTSTAGGGEPKSKGKWYAAALAGLLVLGGGGFYLSQQGDDTSAPVAEVVEQNKFDDATSENAFGTTPNEQDQDGATTDDATIETPADDASEGGTPANSGQNQEGAAPAGMSNAPVTASETPAKKNSEPVANTAKQNTISAVPVTSVSGEVEEAAMEVVRGKYGNGAVRKRNLGDRYAEIQSKVNEMYRNGQVH